MFKNLVKTREYMKIYERAEDIPSCWDDFCNNNYFMNRKRLKFLESVNNCKQKYYIVYNQLNQIEACFVMFPFRYEFSRRTKIKVKLIFLPLSVADPGIVARKNSEVLAKCLKKIKGIKMILSTSEDFALLNGIKQQGLPNCIMNVSWNTFEEYIDSMRYRYRKKIKNMIKKRESLDKRVLLNNEEFSEEMYELYEQVMNHAGYVLENLNLDFFHNDFSKTIVLELNGKAKAFVQFVEVNEKIIAEFCGFDYKERDKYDLYNNTILSLIEYAIENGFKIIDIGQSAEEAKLKFGCDLEPKYSWIFYNGNKLYNAILKFILFHDTSPRETHKFNVFRKDDVHLRDV